MATRPLALAIPLLVFVVGLSGCLQQPATPPTGPSPSTDLPLPRSLVPGFQFLNCTEVLLTFEVPQAAAASVIPAAFQPHGITPATVRVNAVAEDCPRTTTNDSVLGASRHYWTFAFAEPKNHSWRKEGYISYYVLDYATDSRELVGRLAALGIPVDSAAIDVSSQPLATGGRLMDWRAATQNYSASFHYRAAPDQPQWGGGYFHLWFGTTEFRRVDLHAIRHVDTLDAAGEFTTDGSSRLGAILKSPVLAWKGASFDDGTELWNLNETTYCMGAGVCRD